MTTATVTHLINGLRIRVEVEARANDLSEDASRAAEAASNALQILALPRSIQELRAEYNLALEGEIDTDCTETYYGRLIGYLEGIATIAATDGWHNPEAFVTVDVDAA